MTRLVCIFLLSATSLFAQGFGQLPAFRAAGAKRPASGGGGGGGFAPTNIAGMALWWKASDVTAGNVASWVDRIQGKAARRTADTHVKSDSTGILFDGTSGIQLTNASAITLSVPFSFWYIIKPTTAPPSGNWYTVWNSQNNSAGSFAVHTPGGNYSWDVEINVGDNVYGQQLLVNNTIYDLVCTEVSAITPSVWTNGVASTRVSGADTGTSTDFFFIGDDSQGDPMNGYIIEIGVWTNTTLSSTSVSNLHYYSTNTYGYTP